jgi:crotonobetainyl-CoA:carnitine CoA-transferase CaiB-like acyl-CoA transferase
VNVVAAPPVPGALLAEETGTRSDRQVLDGLLDVIGIGEADTDGTIRIEGTDPVVDSRFRPGIASAAALAAQGAAVAAIWRMRGGPGQDVSVDVRQAAVPGLQTINHIRQNGVFHELYPRSRYDSHGFYRTRDGRQIYVLRAPLYTENLLQTLELLGCSYAPDSMAAAIGRWDALDLEDALAERRLVGVIARSRAEWLAHPQGAWLAARPPVEIEKIGDSAPEPLGPAARPLSGLRVLDFTHVLAGPVSSRTLAEQGADVLHVIAQHHMDPVRLSIDTGLGKRSAFLNIDRPDDAATLLKLGEGADVFVHSWRTGGLDRRGFSPEEMAARRPGLIYLSVSCYGSGGPWAARGGYEPCGQTACGLVLEEGSDDAPRLAVTGTLNDYVAGYLAAAGVLGALVRRAREGGSYHVKVSLTRASMWVQEIGMLPRSQWPSQPLPMGPRPQDLQQMESPFGTLTVPRPITRYSETEAYWSVPPQPAGASLPAWFT